MSDDPGFGKDAFAGEPPALPRAASDFLAAHWFEGRHLEALPSALRPRSRAEAYAIQALIEGREAGSRHGWKIAATSLAGQRHINVDGPLAGRLLAGRTVPEGEPVQLGTNRMRVAEVEFAFRVGRSFVPRAEPFGVDEVMDGVAALHLAIEVPDSRFLDFTTAGAPQLIADNACADRFILGPEVRGNWRGADLAAHAVRGVVSRPDGTEVVHEGRGGNALGDPRLALAWLVNELRQHGVVLGAGEVVTTGTCVVPLPVGPGDVARGDYGNFGSLEVRFAPPGAGVP